MNAAPLWPPARRSRTIAYKIRPQEPLGFGPAEIARACGSLVKAHGASTAVLSPPARVFGTHWPSPSWASPLPRRPPLASPVRRVCWVECIEPNLQIVHASRAGPFRYFAESILPSLGRGLPGTLGLGLLTSCLGTIDSQSPAVRESDRRFEGFAGGAPRIFSGSLLPSILCWRSPYFRPRLIHPGIPFWRGSSGSVHLLMQTRLIGLAQSGRSRAAGRMCGQLQVLFLRLPPRH